MKTLLIDSSYLIYKSYFAYPNLTNEGEPVGACFGYIKTILQLIQTYKPDQLVIAGDTPKPTWRHKIALDYKAGRAKVEDNLNKQFPLINEWASKITSNYYSIEGYEADDVIFTIAMELLTNMEAIPRSMDSSQSSSSILLFEEEKESFVPPFPYNLNKLISDSNQKSNQILIFSSDRDLYQMLGLRNIKFLHGSKNGLEEFGESEFVEKYSLNPMQWLDYKALVGDSSDNLKGVEGIGPKTATGFLQQFGSLYRFFELAGLDNCPFFRTSGSIWSTQCDPKNAFEDTKNSSLIQKLILNYEVIKHTYVMSSLQIVPNVKIKTDGYELKNGLGDVQKYGFKSLVNMLNKLDPQEAEGLF